MQRNRITHKQIIAIAGLALLLFVGFVALFSRTIHRDTFDPQSSAEQGGDYLVRHFHNDGGHFDYLYDPKEDRVSSSYNLLRHAGTTYALLSLYDAIKKPEYLTIAEQALKFINAQEAPCPAPRGSLVCLYEDESVKLGGNALALLAFTEHVRVTNDTEYLKKAQSYAEWMMATQNERGEFTQHEQTREGKTTDLVSEYYPGEAIFALMRLYTLDHNDRWRVSAEKGAKWLIETRDAGKATSTLPHDHWLLYGLNELHAVTADPLYLAHARKITDAIASTQHVTAEDVRWVGGFYNPPRSTPTATRVEGLVAAYALFVRAGDAVYAERAKEVIDRAVPFLLRTQVTKERAQSAGLNQDGALGGFTESLDEYDIRIDYVQHNISALLGYLALQK
jgi:hypothetical protein